MRRNIIFILGFLTVAFITSSCLKDEFGENWTSDLKGKMYAQFQYPNFHATTIQTADTVQHLTIMLNIASDAKPSTENTITVDFDAAAMQAYNDDQASTDTTYLPFIMYPGATIDNPQVTVPAGTRVAFVTISLPNAVSLDLNYKYMVPLTITAATNGIVIAENLKTVLMAVPVANQYEGSYASTGRIHKLTAWDRTWESNKDLATVDANTTSFSVADIGLPCNITVDPATNKVTSIFNTDLTYDFLLNTPELNLDDQGGISRWDPDSHTFYLYYYYIGTGNLARVASEVLVRQ
jgi:hypothetical protein